VFEKGVLKKIFGPKREEVTGDKRRLHNEELCELYFPSNINRVIKSRMRWAGHVARWWERRGAYRVLVRKLEGARLLARSRGRWGDNIKSGFSGSVMVAWTGLIWLMTGTSGVSCKCGNESSGSIKYGDQLRTG